MESKNIPMLTIPRRAASFYSRDAADHRSAPIRRGIVNSILIPLVAISACATPRAERPAWPDVSPAAQPATEQVLKLDPTQVQPMYQEL